MQNNEFEKLIQRLKSVRLSQDEKTQMLKNIRFEMREQKAAPKISGFSLRAIFMNKFAVAALCALLVIVSSFGISKAAENSLPGDFLYPIKTNVNEKIQAALAKTPEQKAKVEAAITVERLDEAEKLQQQGKLDQQKTQQITQNLAEHAAAVQQSITEVQKDHNSAAAAQLNVNLDNSLKAHVQILDKLSGMDDSKDNSGGDFSDRNSSIRMQNTTRHDSGRNSAIMQLRLRADDQNQMHFDHSGRGDSGNDSNGE